MLDKPVAAETPHLDIWHNIVWSRYKGQVFSELHRIARERGLRVNFFQIAETEGMRAGLTEIDTADHRYPFTLLFRGAHESVPVWKLCWSAVEHVWRSRAPVILLAGYHRPEYWLQLFAARLRRKRIAVFCDSTVYDQPQTWPKSLFKVFFFAHCDMIFCYGDRARAYVRQFGVPDEHITMRCQAAALPADYNAQKALADRLALAPDPAHPRFLYVGRLAPEKQLKILLAAFAKLLPSMPLARLVLVGTGPKQAELEKLAASLSIAANVDFAGARAGDALAREYLSATALILPSASEPWGLVVNEALSYGCPVIVSDRCGCVPELVVKGVTGFTVKSGDVEDMAARMQQVIPLAAQAESTAQACLSHIAPFTPLQAAEQILGGYAVVTRPRAISGRKSARLL